MLCTSPRPRPILVGEVECKLGSVQMIINIVLGEGVNFYISEGNLMSGLILSRFQSDSGQDCNIKLWNSLDNLAEITMGTRLLTKIDVGSLQRVYIR